MLGMPQGRGGEVKLNPDLSVPDHPEIFVVGDMGEVACVSRLVGWLGAGAGFLALAIVGMTSQDSQMVRAAYFAMD